MKRRIRAMGAPKGKKKEDEHNDFVIRFWDDDDHSDDETPEGCQACGGPYPDCTASCPAFED
jgi:heterodisulfide reductase subunit C